jgi:heme exporter protein B
MAAFFQYNGGSFKCRNVIENRRAIERGYHNNDRRLFKYPPVGNGRCMDADRYLRPMLSSLLRMQFLLEFRQRATLGGVLVYVAGTVFVSALCFSGKMDKPTWNAMLWTITLFTSVTVSGKSFVREGGGQALFNYIHYDPRTFIVSKILFNMIFMLALSLITFCCYAFFISNQVENLPLFLIVLVTASCGLAGVLSLMSAIAAKAGSGFALMSILSFPVVMPLVLLSVRLSRQAVDGIEWAGVNTSFIVILGALNVLTITLAVLLFPYLWRD